MPAIFLISGIATYYALTNRRAGRFIKDRSLRLLVPLLVGLFTHIPLQGYLTQVNYNLYGGSFWQWFPTMFKGPAWFGTTFNWLGGHLWYLEVLFLYSLVLLPLFILLRNGSGKRILSWLNSRLSAPGVLYLPALVIILLSATLNPDSGSLLTSEDFGGWNLPSHLIFFLSGFMLASSQAMQASILRIRWISLIVCIAIFVVGAGVLLTLTGGEVVFGTPLFLVWAIISSVTGWAGMLAILGFGMHRLNVKSPVLDYANEAVLPFYILHQSILFVVGFYVLNWSIPDLMKWIIILSVTFVIIMILYEFLIRRINLLRVLFGMKPVYKEKVVQKAAAQVS